MVGRSSIRKTFCLCFSVIVTAHFDIFAQVATKTGCSSHITHHVLVKCNYSCNKIFCSSSESVGNLQSKGTGGKWSDSDHHLTGGPKMVVHPVTRNATRTTFLANFRPHPKKGSVAQGGARAVLISCNKKWDQVLFPSLLQVISTAFPCSRNIVRGACVSFLFSISFENQWPFLGHAQMLSPPKFTRACLNFWIGEEK